MSAIEHWKRKVRAARASRQAHQERVGRGFWGAERAAWFNRFAGKSDRSHTYCFVEPYVRGQVLEVGPGPGAYTRLMAPVADRIVAVEPSPDMIQRLRENLAGVDNLEIVESTIEDYLPRLEAYDLSLAANVLSGIEPIDAVLEALTSHARMTAIIMWSNARTPAWSEDVQRAVLGRETVTTHMPDHADLLGVLGELALSHTEHVVHVPVHTFSSAGDVVEWVQGFHGIAPERRPELEEVLSPHISERDGKFGLLNGRDTRVVLVPGRT